MHNPALKLPDPDTISHSISIQLESLLRSEIADNNGRITFERYMELALYSPDLGYYVSGNQIFGEGGDFTTAPELSPFFSKCMAKQIQQVFNEANVRNVLEFGAGSGTMACNILLELNALGALPDTYYIFEVSPALQERQFIKLKAYAPEIVDRVTWVDAVPDDFEGVMVANEVLDAMPIHRVRFHSNGEHEEIYVASSGGALVSEYGPPSSPELGAYLQKIHQALPDLQDNYETEINLRAFDWIRDLAAKLKRGLILLIDYGYPQHEYFLPERYQGTLMCHYKHIAHANALIYPGLQDITAHVDFTSIADVAFDSGLDVCGFNNQGNFLAGCGLEAIISSLDINDAKNFLIATQGIKKLIMPSEMGELFKVIGLSKDLDMDLIGFYKLDQRARL